MQICKYQQEWGFRSEGLQRVPDFAEHALASGALDTTLHQFAMLRLDQRRKLSQPGRCLRDQDTDHRVAFRTTAQLRQRLKHRIVGLFASVAFGALSAGETDRWFPGYRPALKFIDQGGLPDPRLSGDEDDLAYSF